MSEAFSHDPFPRSQEALPGWKKNASIFIASQAISLFGTALVQYAISWHIALDTKSGIDMTLAIICGFLPTFFLSPFGGVWADRYNRKKLIMAADGGIAFCTLILAALFMAGYTDIRLLFLALGLRALGSAVQNPCVGAMLPDIVPPDQLTRINGINGSVQSMIFLLSPMLSGVLLSFAPVYAVFFIDVFTAAAAILVMLFFLKLPAGAKAAAKSGGTAATETGAAAQAVSAGTTGEVPGEAGYGSGAAPEAGTPSPETGTAPPKTGYFDDLKKGVAYITGHPYLRAFFLFMAAFNLMAAPIAFLSPLQVVRTFGDDAWRLLRLSAIEIGFSGGMMAGGLIIASWGGLRNRIHTMVAGGVTMSICTIIMGVPPRFFIYVTMMAIAGLSMPFFNTPATVLLQEQVEPEYMGRIFGVLTMVNSVMMPAGMLIFGPLADILRIEWLLIASGTAMLLLSLAILGNRDLLRAGLKRPGPKGSAAHQQADGAL